MSMRVLGIDPGLTRCGVGIVDVRPDRRATLVEVTRHPHAALDAVSRSACSPSATASKSCSTTHRPAAVAIERVFAQHNLRTVMGTAQVSGVALHAAAKRGLPVALHTPSEVKAAITGYGSADKKQVQAMVARILGLAEVPKPADAADALALAICHAWRGAPAAARGARPQATLHAGPGGVARRGALQRRASAAPRRLAR